MASWLCCIKGKLCVERFLVAAMLLGLSWNAAVSARADDGPAKRNPASASAETIYTVTYAAADILSRIQDERHFNAEDAKEFLGNRVKGPPVMQSALDRQRLVRIDEPQWLEDRLVVSANQTGHEQVSAMLAAFRKFGVAEYAISVHFVTMQQEQALEAFPDLTSSALTTNANQASSSDAVSTASEISPTQAGATAFKARTIIEDDSPMRFRVLDDDALAKLLNAVRENLRSNSLDAPPVTTYNGQTASLSDVARSQFVVGANLLPSGGHELKTREVTEGTSMFFRPIAEPNGDIRLEFAASFTKIENVSKEVLKIAPDKEITLQFPKVATCHVDGGAVLKPGQSLMFGGVKRLVATSRTVSLKDKLLGGWSRPKEPEVQDLIVILRVEPFELPNRAAARVASAAERK